MKENNQSKFARKATMIKRYDVCERTLEKWMNAGLLVFIRVRRVVRFDIEACDRSLMEHGFI